MAFNDRLLNQGAVDVNGRTLHERLIFGTYKTLDLTQMPDSFMYYSTVPTVLMKRGSGMIALSDLQADQKYIGVSITSAGSAAAIAGTQLDFGVGSGMIEAWVTVESVAGSGVTGDRYLLQLGTTTQAFLILACNIASANAQTWKAQLKTTDGTILWDLTTATYNSFNQTGGASQIPIHVIFAWSRSGDTTTCTLWINGAITFNTGNLVVGSSAKPVDFSANSVSNSGIYVGQRGAGTTNGWPGRIYAVRAYKTYPTDLQVTTLNRLGPQTFLSSLLPSWYLNLQNRSSWSNANQPEGYRGDTNAKVTTFNANGSSLNLDSQLIAYSAGDFPSAEINGRGLYIPANAYTKIRKPANNMVVFTDSAVDGIVRINGTA